MPYDEFLSWVAYRNQRGTLHAGLRMEWLFARLAVQINRATGGKLEFEDAVRYYDKKEASIDDIAAALGIRTVKTEGNKQ